MINRYPMSFLAITATIFLLILGSLEPIPQDLSYHNFADARTLYSVPNFWNVITNLPFLFVGIYALHQMLRLNTMVFDRQMKAAYVFLFVGVSLVAFGSGYYHLDPNNDTLLWDRLPMAIAFMALLAIIIAEFIGTREGRSLLYPLLALGVVSVGYWAYSEAMGHGDLRLYLFVQFYPIVMIPILLIGFTSAFTLRRGYWYLLLCYLLAKVFEHYDVAIYEMLGFLSGHSLKHMMAALGLYVLVRVFALRKRVENTRENRRSKS